MKCKAENDSYESDVISLEYWQQPTRVHVLKYDPSARDAYQNLRRILNSMNRNLHGGIDDTVAYDFNGIEIYTPYDAVDAQYLEALREAISKIERDVQKRKNKWGIDRFDHDSILDEVHRVFYDLMYNKEHFLMRYLGPSV